ncbi:MAG: DUF2950 domain-containing protein [Proteobacteria bacterium]|nr:DUF2950 domain-containing protein [Pseudomonadota bacterium]
MSNNYNRIGVRAGSVGAWPRVCGLVVGVVACCATFAAEPAATPAAATAPAAAAAPASVETFGSADQAAAAIIAAARSWDTGKLTEMLGPDGDDIIFSGDYEADRQRGTDFASQADKKTRVAVDPKTGARAVIFVGENDWPFPVPVVKRNGKWLFDATAGKRELMYRRIGENELDAIDICRGYVEAQYDYAERPREGYEVAQYAQRIISTPGKQDGLAWQNADGTWGGPIGENIAKAIKDGLMPYHGYFFKILKGQGASARLGEMDYVINGVMIGGFALVAAPAEYGVTGFKTFMVSYNGVVYQKDFGTKTAEQYQKMQRYDPDKSWQAVPDDE